MDYELAKQLKDAGFPRKGNDSNWICEHANPAINCSQMDICDSIYNPPTLFELIEACGDRFKCLIQDDLFAEVPKLPNPKVMFHAEMWQRDKTIWMNTMFEGSTPEIAVAKLWLELNKNNSVV